MPRFSRGFIGSLSWLDGKSSVDTGGEEIHQSTQKTRFAVFFLNIFRKLSRLFKLNERFKEFLRKLLGGGR